MRLIPAIFLLLLLAGCGRQSPEALFEDYLERLGNLTGVELPDADPPNVPLYPGARDLVLPAADIRVNVADFLSLGECGLVGKISERNSPLGRLQRESGRLLYELDFYRTLSDCAARIKTGSEARDFRREVAGILEAKAANLPVVFWNASFGAKEFRIFMDTATPPLQRDEQPSLARFGEPLRRLVQLGGSLQTAPPANPAEFEQLYFQLQADKTGGKIVRSLNLGAFYLARAAANLEAAPGQRICPVGRKTETAEYLFNVFLKFYAGGVQPYVSRVHQAGEALRSGVADLRAIQRAPIPPAFAAWYAETLDAGSPSSLWNRYNAALDRHTKAWKNLLQPCGLMPAGPIGS